MNTLFVTRVYVHGEVNLVGVFSTLEKAKMASREHLHASNRTSEIMAWAPDGAYQTWAVTTDEDRQYKILETRLDMIVNYTQESVL